MNTYSSEGFRLRLGHCVSILMFCVLLGACSRVDAPRPGVYRAVLHLPGGEAPFGLDVATENQQPVIYLINGTERTRVAAVTLQDSELIARFPGYENYLRARLYRDRLEGEVVLIKAGGVEQRISFEAQRGLSHRFFKEPSTDNADVAGRWQVQLRSENGATVKAVAEFQQEHDRVTGTVLTPTGDHRYLAGQVRGDELWLSTFAGGLAYLYKLRVTSQGELQGEYWQGLNVHEQVRAQRDAGATLQTDARTQLKDRSVPFDFTFPNVDGQRISLSDSRFQGKVVIVTIGGTWCPNCHDEARFLVPFYKQYRERGVEVVGLMFERHGDFKRAAQAVHHFKTDMSIPYPLLVAGVSDSEQAAAALPTLTGIYGYPTALFVDRTGQVRKIHTGFAGPASPKDFERHTQAFIETVESLLQEG